MSEIPESSLDPAPQSKTDERRSTPRFFARAKAIVFRDNDAMGDGLPASLYDLSIFGLSLTIDDDFLGMLETIKIRLCNDVQKFDREVRGVVRHITPLDDGRFRVGIELLTRLTPLEVSMLKMTPLTGDSDSDLTWV